MKKFPKDFLWGASTSAYQFEGGINEGGKVPSIMDNKEGHPKYGKDITGFKDASHHYYKWKEDISLMAEMGFKSYRFSISWPRIIKNLEGDVNMDGIKFYDDLLDELKKYGIEPIVTMFHFDYPDFVSEIGGIQNARFSNLFEIYSKVLFEYFGDKVNYWLTINELNIMVLSSSAIGTGDDVSKWQVMHNLNVAQAKAIRLCRKMLPKAKIGPAPNIAVTYAKTCDPTDYTAKLNLDQIRNWVYLDIVCRGSYSKNFLNFVKASGENFVMTEEEKVILNDSKPDFIAFNYYSTATVSMTKSEDIQKDKADQQKGIVIPGFAKMVPNEFLEKTQFGWEIDPIGFRNTLRDVYDRYQLPIMITENGIGARDVLNEDGTIHDDYRIEYYKKHIEQMSLAIQDGVDVIGYMPWSAIDLVSTHEGISKRYGFVYVDRDEFDLKDMNRYKKDSFFWYKELIKNNGENI
ncbi:glycoside hydrolase family 1 protein [Mesoplasma coleopterae]|uniref:glycoside hydrolase family 1 protein n=1 Tax=Mesoplasma coleopterae TaxID=324078 RepID=UPI000D02FA45|nr:glycoside hydrolase family 1 protein [Mesoplasma coleopterae]AVN62742.1 6-phospho-beta-glucosidase [Mesoplasma coleopterae]